MKPGETPKNVDASMVFVEDFDLDLRRSLGSLWPHCGPGGVPVGPNGPHGRVHAVMGQVNG